MPYGLPDSWGAWATKKVFGGVIGASTKGVRAGAGGRSSSTHYTYTFSKLNLYRPILKSYLNGRTGPIWRQLDVRGRLIVTLAKKQVGKKTGALANSIKMEHKSTIRGQELKIGSSNKIAYLHHEGTRPHLIVPKDAPQLVFFSKGRIIRTQLVRHPGTKPNRYLTDQMYIFEDLGRIYKGKNFPPLK
jgi:hypothetical protein